MTGSPPSQRVKRRKRVRSPHPGVVLIGPDPKRRIRTWRARFTDPDTDRLVWESLDPLVLRSAELRRAWAIRKAQSLAKRRSDLAAGAPRATGTTIEQGIELYFSDAAQLSPNTVVTYRLATASFAAWSKREGIDSLDDIGRPELLRFRAAMLKLPKRASAPSEKRGRKREQTGTRSAISVNRDLRALSTALNYLRKLDKLPRITSDDLRDGLERYDQPRAQPEYLTPDELRELFAAAARHDAECYAKTRDEHAGLLPAGSTPRYAAISPLLAGALLTGMRLGEATSVTFEEHLALDALDHDGAAVGELRLPPSITKTKHARVVGLGDVSPALRALIAALKLAAGGKGPIFGVSYDEAVAAGKRLAKTYGAPKRFTWQMLRSTCSTYLTNAPSIFGAASAYQSARRTGHSVTVAEKHYAGLVRGISREARTLEAAMQVEAEVRAVVERVTQRSLTEQPRVRQLRS
ncbi:MAG TPA: hypothetical protein VFN67_42535 [Polyangiales bacterium]|nr:hypothetical protein [Polyangiales bacterium]